MAETTNIAWTEATWNPWHGCHKVSQGCKNCYMFRDKTRYGQDPNVVVRSKTKFYDPLKWREPQTIFTCSWSDFFIEESDPWRDEAFAIMALTPQHTYQVLTKRPERMLEYLTGEWMKRATKAAFQMADDPKLMRKIPFLDPKKKIHKPLDNVWLGVSVEDQKTADERIPLLLKTPAALRWLSIEPLLGPVDLDHEWGAYSNGNNSPLRKKHLDGIDWIIAGGESGPDARPMHPDWVRSIRDQCQGPDVPFFFKQGSQANWPHFKDFDKFPAEFQIREFPR